MLPTERGEDLRFLLEQHFVVIPLQTRTHQCRPGQEIQAANGNKRKSPLSKIFDIFIITDQHQLDELPDVFLLSER